MSQLELLSLLVKVLNDLQIDHMLVGSYASSYYGEARSTHDVDLVIHIEPAKIPEFVASFAPDRYYISEAALREGRMANLIDTHTGDKMDCFLLDDDPYNRQAFSRRTLRNILGIDIPLASAEDTVLAKLKWSELGGGLPQQLDDARAILRHQRDRLDLTYLAEQAKALGLSRWLTNLLKETDDAS